MKEKKALPVNHKPTILLIEDEKPIRRFVKPYLEGREFKVIEAKNGEEGLTLASSRRPDVILLDLGLRDMNGLTVLQRLRQWAKMPVIILTARNRDKEKVEGLDAGADDYVCKPFTVEVLAARIRESLRYLKVLNRQAEDRVFQTHDLRVDINAQKVTLRDQEVQLTPVEYHILSFLFQHLGNPVTQKMLMDEIWGPHNGQVSALKLNIHSLREKIEFDAAFPQYLLTEPGVGYRLRGR